jgi:flagellin FlaB
MFRKLLKTHRGQRGITGLETAIILIAFVVVAAVFAYTALSAGLFSTQKAQEAVYSGLQEAQSTLELKGAVIATAEATGASGSIKQVTFTVANVLGGEPIDFTQPTANDTEDDGLADTSVSNNKVVINYIDENEEVNDLLWTVTKLGDADDDDLLEQNEKFQITIGESTGSAGGNLYTALTTPLTTNKTFSLVVLTPAGAVLEIERTTPAYIDTIMNLR